VAPRFVADCMLGRLARWLRAFGFDVAYHPSADDHQIIALARERRAVALTRDTRMPRAPDIRFIFIEDDRVEQQLRQLVREVPLDLSQARPLSRCTVCNSALDAATRDEVWREVPPFIYLTEERYARCRGCRRVYWEGTHVARIRERISRLAAGADQATP
jgi:uncharacterized protein with PIN domain